VGISLAARLFVLGVFGILGASFIATTAALYYEFGVLNQDGEWTALAAFYSHLFVFFPTFGIVALVAFFIPASAFVDLYFRHVPLGIVRFLIGFLLLAILSWHFGSVLGKGALRSIWEVKPEVLLSDPGQPADCLAGDAACSRVPVMSALTSVREQSQLRVGMGQFVRECTPDPLIEPSPDQQAARYCFAKGEKTDANTCCAAQRQFGLAISAMHLKPENRSLTVWVHTTLLPLKIFFLLVIFTIALLLIFWRRTLPIRYPRVVNKIERGVIAGALVMLFLPLMNVAFLQASGLLYGDSLDSKYRAISPFFVGTTVAWVLLLVFFFVQSRTQDEREELEQVARIGGVVGSGVFALNYNLVVDYFTRLLGAGMGTPSLIGIGVFCLAALLFILLQPKRVLAEIQRSSAAKSGLPPAPPREG